MEWKRGKSDKPPTGSLKEIADFALTFMEIGERSDHEQFWKHKDNAPEWLTDMIRRAHDGMLPDDYKYDYVVKSLSWIAEGNDPESPELEPEYSYSDMAAWLGSSSERFGFVDEAVQEWGHGESITDDIGRGQLHEMEQVYWSVLNSLRKFAEEE